MTEGLDGPTLGGFADGLYGSENLTARSYGKALLELAQADERVVCLGADLTQPTETHLMRDKAAERFVMLGIAEANMIGVAGGHGAVRRHPVHPYVLRVRDAPRL